MVWQRKEGKRWGNSGAIRNLSDPSSLVSRKVGRLRLEEKKGENDCSLKECGDCQAKKQGITDRKYLKLARRMSMAAESTRLKKSD